MTNPYVILGAFAAFILATSGAYVAGRRDGQKLEAGKEAAVAAAIETGARIASEKAAEAFAKQKVIHETINRKVETVIREVPVYRDCVNDPGVELMLDNARGDRAPSEPGGDSGVPGTGAGSAP